jgi:glycosyltransferase involved in cell wall biosynthesis
VSGDLWGGAEAQVAVLLARLARRDDVAVSALLFNAGRLSERLSELAIPVVVSPERGQNAGALARATARMAADVGATLLHSHGYKESFVASAAALLASPRPAHVKTQHSAPGPVIRGVGWKARLYFAIDRLVAARTVDRVIAVSNDIAARLAATVGAAKVRVIANGVEPPVTDAPRVAAARAALGAEPGDILIGAAGRLQRVKGFDVLLDAFGAVAAVAPARLAIFGDGPERAALEARAARLDAAGRVRFTGHVEELTTFLDALDILALPSRHEGMPMTLLEGMMLGRAIVASAVGGIREAVADGESALLVPPEDAGALGAALARLACDPESRAALGRAARARALAEFSAERMADATAALYREVAP